jgi:LysR family hydrogen peroxide-inducible transcriptional activator
MEMQHIRYFLALCDEQNFTRAAKRCGVAQPSLTRAIKRLEKELGGALFERSRKTTALTALGLAIRPHFAEIEQAAAAAKREAAKHGATHLCNGFKAQDGTPSETAEAAPV